MGKRLLCAISLLLSLLSAEAETGEREPTRAPSHATARTPYFEIVAPDVNSANYVARTARELVEVTRAWLRLPVGFSNRILVRLAPPGQYPFDEPFRTRVEMAGNVSVAVRWAEETRREDLERALAQAFLSRIAAWHHVSGEDIVVPLWLESALQQRMRAVGNPAVVDGMVRELRERGPMDIEEILYRGREEASGDGFAVNAYWLLGHLEAHSGRTDRLHNFVIRLLSGEDPKQGLLATFGSVFREEERLRLWWTVGVYELVWRRADMLSHFYDSQQFVRELSRFTYIEEGEREVRLDLRDLWRFRDESVVRSEVRHRIERINYQMRSVHPFHFNAGLSLIRAMISLLDENEEAFRENVAAFRADLQEAEALFREADAALNRLDEELTGGLGR